MTKITLNPVGSLIDATTAATAINANFDTIETAFDNTLSRDGTTPNTMSSVLDMNSYGIVNLPNPVGVTSPLRLQDLEDFIGGGTIQTIPTGGTTGQVLAKVSNTNYDVTWSPVVPLAAGTNISIAGSNPTTVSTINNPTFSTSVTTPTVNADAITVSSLAVSSAVATDGLKNLVSVTNTGSGNNVLANSPVLVTPSLGTPTAVVLTNATGTAAGLTAGNAQIAPAGTLTGTTLAANVVSSSLTSVGTLTGGATGAGFTVALSTATVTGTLAAARLPTTVVQNNIANTFVNPGVTQPQNIQSDSADTTPTSVNNQGLILRNFNTTNNNYIPLEFHSKDTGGTERTGSGIMGVFSNRSASMVKSDLIFFTRSLSGAVNFPMYLSDTLLVFGNSPTAASPALKANGTALTFRLGDDSAAADLTAATGSFSGGLTAYSGTAVPAGGTTGTGFKFSLTSNLGLFFGSGAPTLSAAQGSLYIRTDGSSTSTRVYVNTNGSTTWTNITTAT